MPRAHYINVHAPPGGHRDKWLRAICDQLELGHAHRDRLVAIDAALAAMVAGLTENMKEEEMYITVEFSEAALFGNVDPEEEGINVDTSVANFADAVVNHLYDAYPKAEIKVERSINDRVLVDIENEDEVPAIEAIIDTVWNGDDWMVS